MKEEKIFEMNKKYNLLFIIVILAAGFIAYSNSFDCSFHFDDWDILFKNIITKSSTTASDWIHIYPSRPLGVLTFAANYNIHKLDVWGYHLVNLMIHLINAFLVWWLTFITFSTPVMKEASISRHKNTIAFLTGMLFVTHPLATQSVTYIYQRLASLATLFYLLSVILFVKGKLQENNKTAMVLFCASIVSGVCGILTKEIVFTLPFAIILYYYCFMKTSAWKPELKDKSLIVCFIMLAILILFFFRYFSLDKFNTVQPRQGYSYAITMKEYFLTQFSVILTYIRLFFLPFNQNLDYNYSLSTSFFQLKTFFSFLALMSILLSGVLLFKKYRLISFGIFWFFITLSVESSIIPISQNVIFEHRTYLPGFGFFIAFTGAFFYLFREKYLQVALIILLLIATVNTYLTYQRNKIWKDDYTLWNDCVTKSPDKARTRNNRGTVYIQLGQHQLAVEDFNHAIRINPDYTEAYYNLGLAYYSLGQYQRAIENYNEAIRLNPNLVEPYNNRGNTYNDLGLRQQAIEDYNQAIRLRPDYAEAYNNRGVAYYFQGNVELACRDLQRACDLGYCKILEEVKHRGSCR